MKIENSLRYVKLLPLQVVLLIWTFNYPARLLILTKKQSQYLEVTKFQSIFAKE